MNEVYETIGKMILEKLTSEGMIDHRILRNERIKTLNNDLKEKNIGYQKRVEELSETLLEAPAGGKYMLSRKSIEKIIKG